MERSKLLTILIAVVFGAAWWVTTSIEDYRTRVFRTMPLDDYIPYILYIASAGEEGMLPISPMRERVLSVVATIPFYIVAPEVRFSLLDEGIDVARLKASLALSATNSLAFMIAAILVSLAVAAHTGAPIAATAVDSTALGRRSANALGPPGASAAAAPQS